MTGTPQHNLTVDAALPQRDLLLDVGEVARRFSARLGADGAIKIDHCQQLRVKYAPGLSLRTVHRIQVGEATYTIAARTFTRGRSKLAFEETAKNRIACNALLPVAHDAELETIYWTFPNDRKLSNLGVLVSPPEEFATIYGECWRESRVVAYAPEKCVTAECLNEKNEVLAYAKVYADDEPGSHTIYKALAGQLAAAKSNLLIPRLLAYSQACRLLLLEPIAGCRLADLSGAARTSAFWQLGTALAMLHDLPAPEELPPFKRLDLKRLKEAAEVVGEIRPDVAQLANTLARELCNRREASGAAEVFLHGDVHPKNGILQNNRVAMVDMDQAGRGPAAADLGSLLAALRYCRCIGTLSRADEAELAGAFLSGYRLRRNLPTGESLRWHQAAALLAERAKRAVCRVRREGLECLNELLTEARRVLSAKVVE